MALFTTRSAPADPHTPRAWEQLLDDLDSAAATIAALESELAESRAEAARLRMTQAGTDALIGRLVRQRDFHAGHARHAYEQLRLVRERELAARAAAPAETDVPAEDEAATGQPVPQRA